MADSLHRPLPALLVIGGGNMGRAIVQRAVQAETLDPARVVVVDPEPARHEPFAAIGLACARTLEAGLAALAPLEAAEPALVLLAVKPQMLPEVAAQAGGRLRGRAVLSILAGTTTARLADALAARPVRLMPNTPAQVGRGITAICGGDGATEADLAAARRLFESVGRVIDLPEDLLDAFTAVAGSGPAYVFLLAEGLAAGAEAAGFDRQTALRLVRATISGAAALMEAEPETEPAELRARVTSKGGTTAAAVGVLEDRAVRDALRDAVLAARDRGRELGA